MKLLVAGCGSIGGRHASNAAAFAETGLFDTDRERARSVAAETGARAFEEWEQALAWGPLGVVVATPHSSHLEVAGDSIEAGADVLVEKPLSQTLAGVDALLDRADTLGRKVFVVTNLRFHPAVETLKVNLGKIGKPLSAKAHFGSHLPTMRPGTDYRALDCVRPGFGGVVLDNIHEYDYLIWFFGEVQEVIASEGRLGGLDMEAADYSCALLRHKNGLRSEIHLNWLQRPKRRGCEIIGSGGSLIWNSDGRNPERCRVYFHPADGGECQTLLETEAVDVDRPFRTLMEYFVSAVAGEDAPLASGRNGALVLKTALTACRSAELGKAIDLSGKRS